MTSAVIATRNRLDKLEITIPTWKAQAGLDEIIVVDDGSTDGSGAWLAEQDGVRLVTLQSGGYRQPAWAYHAGIDAAEGDIIVWGGGEIAVPHEGTVLTLLSGLHEHVVHLGRVYNVPVMGGGAPGADWIWDGNECPGLAAHAPTVYCGEERRVPFMFLGAFYKSMWRRTGGYSLTAGSASDAVFATHAHGMGVRFFGKGQAVAYHLTHGKT